jgi:uncharacterized protein (TIGR02466 family)
MQIEHLFTTPLATDFLNIDNSELEKYCKFAVANTVKPTGNLVANQSGVLDLTLPVMQPLVQEMNQRINEYYYSLGFNKSSRLKILQAWCSTNNTESIDVPHVHVQSEFTAVYYVKGFGSSSGNLNLLSPVPVVIHKLESRNVGRANNGFNSAGWQITPETGKLVLFPSWIVHMVSKNTLPDDRISIAFDLIVEY